MGDQVTARVLANLLGVSEKAISELAKRGIVARAICSRSEREQLLRVSAGDRSRSRWGRRDAGQDEVEESAAIALTTGNVAMATPNIVSTESLLRG
jgi:hypothetical protein